MIIGAGIGTAAIASLATAAAPAVVAHSSGMAIMWSGTGYVAGTIGLGAATVAALPIIATVGAVTAGGAFAYKYRHAIVNEWNIHFGEEESSWRFLPKRLTQPANRKMPGFSDDKHSRMNRLRPRMAQLI